MCAVQYIRKTGIVTFIKLPGRLELNLQRVQFSLCTVQSCCNVTMFYENSCETVPHNTTTTACVVCFEIPYCRLFQDTT